MKTATTILLMIIFAATAWGEPADSTAVTPRKTWVKSFLDYFNDANKNKNNKKFDFSIIGGPHYSTDTELGLGLVAAGLYRNHDTDSLLRHARSLAVVDRELTYYATTAGITSATNLGTISVHS